MKKKIMKKKINKITLTLGLVLGMITIGSINASAWTGSNYYDNWETYGGLYHNGEVQVKPSYNDGGYHYAQGYFIFDNGADGRVATYTEMGTSKQDGRLLYKYKQYRDRWTLEEVPKVTFNVGAAKVPYGSNMWPISN